MLLLLDVHAVLDHLYLDGTQPGITAPAEDYLRESAGSAGTPGSHDRTAPGVLPVAPPARSSST